MISNESWAAVVLSGAGRTHPGCEQVSFKMEVGDMVHKCDSACNTVNQSINQSINQLSLSQLCP